MGKSIEISAKTIDEAIETALAELGGLERENVTVEVLETPKAGFLGIGGTPALVKVTELGGGATGGAAEFLKGIFEHMGTEITLREDDSEDGVLSIELIGESLGSIIGRRGETLDALQHLANLVENRARNERVRVSLDAENYRKKREDSLEKFAQRAAEQVLKYKRSKTLEPMNAYERHVIHTALQEVANVSTSSTGVEPNRRVVISYTGADAPARTSRPYRRPRQ